MRKTKKAIVEQGCTDTVHVSDKTELVSENNVSKFSRREYKKLKDKGYNYPKIYDAIDDQTREQLHKIRRLRNKVDSQYIFKNKLVVISFKT